MAEYHRFVAYVYEYQKAKKGKNVGFIRVQIQKKRCTMEISLRCIGLFANAECEIYGLVRETEELKGILLGKCKTKEHQIYTVLELDAQNPVESGIAVCDFSGILLMTKEGARFASAWDDQPIWLERFSVKEKEKEHQEEKTEQELIEGQQVQEEVFEDDAFVQCWKVKPCNMEAVFQTNPFLQGNRFMIHGCSYYGHLLIAQKKDGQFILGVPGSFDQQECFMAGIFGFPYFKESPMLRLHKNGGYWYRSINPPDLNNGNCFEKQPLEILKL